MAIQPSALRSKLLMVLKHQLLEKYLGVFQGMFIALTGMLIRPALNNESTPNYIQ